MLLTPRVKNEFKIKITFCTRHSAGYCRSYLPLSTFLSTVNPAFFARTRSFPFAGLNVDKILRTGFLHAGQFVSGLAESGRFNVNFPPQTLQPPSHSSYS